MRIADCGIRIADFCVMGTKSEVGSGKSELPRSVFRVRTWEAAVGAIVFGWAGSAVSGQTLDPKQRPTAATSNCTTSGCHSEITKLPVQHGPAAVGTCTACHKATDEKQHRFEIARTQADLCYFCHDQHKGDHVHAPVTQGDCLGCHNPHGGATRQFLKASSVGQMCATCHANVTAGKVNVHGPVAAGACTACHNPHASHEKNLLLRRGNAMCLECHVSVQERLDHAASTHEPVKTDCLRCHTPHASDERMMLVNRPETLCLSCHEDIRNTVQHAKTAHGAVVQGRKCLNCHEPHATAFARILKNNPMDLCLECHNKELPTPQGKIANMAALLAGGKSLHGPIAQKNCAACHEIHGSSKFRLLTKEYPPEFYAPFKEESYALCFSCHEKALVHDPQTTTLTGFRNGALNLHFLHVNRETKGRTCRACHETHASEHEKHIRNTVPFGKWNMPIEFQKTPTGGSCMPGCHVRYQYDRDKPVQYAPSPSKAIWPVEGSPPPPGATGGGS